jgi:hypothetical protein
MRAAAPIWRLTLERRNRMTLSGIEVLRASISRTSGRHCGQTGERKSVAGSGGTEQLLGASSGLVEIGVLRKYRHHVSLTSGGWLG